MGDKSVFMKAVGLDHLLFVYIQISCCYFNIQNFHLGGILPFVLQILMRSHQYL